MIYKSVALVLYSLFLKTAKLMLILMIFFSELKVLRVSLPEKLMSAYEILRFVKAADSYPNVSFAYRILLTIPVIVASAERSFSKLKLLRNCLRSTMSQERLNGLAMCSIEKDIWMTLILIQFLKFLHQEMPEDSFLQRTEALYFYLR